MEKKIIANLTNENVARKFKSSFDLVNYAIKLAENMISTGRDARVKSEVQNRAMLILEEIREGKDQFDEIKITTVASPASDDLNGANINRVVHEERTEKRKSHSADVFEDTE